MSSFIRSALSPILTVIIVAMLIEWVIQGNSGDDTPKARARLSASLTAASTAP